MNDMPWCDVIAAGIRTTSDGPFAQDTFFVFVLRDGDVREVPGTNADFDAIGAHLPGVDWGKVIRAASCTEDRVIRIWHRDDSRNVPSTEELLARFASVIRRLGGTPISRVSERLLAAWDEPARRYHNREHLVECLRELDRCAAATNLVELALWYHDAVYDPRATDNEERSAALLIHHACELGIVPGVAHAAAALVRATTHGGATCADPEVTLVQDIDLSILGRDRLRFMEYDEAIRDEYAHVAPAAFRAGRGRLLRSLLARPKLFVHDEIRARYEASARENVTALLARYS